VGNSPLVLLCQTKLGTSEPPPWKGELIEGNKEINWYPGARQRRAFGDWLAHNVDWAFPVRGTGGTPLPEWKCEKVRPVFEMYRQCRRTYQGKPDAKMDSMGRATQSWKNRVSIFATGRVIDDTHLFLC